MNSSPIVVFANGIVGYHGLLALQHAQADIARVYTQDNTSILTDLLDTCAIAYTRKNPHDPDEYASLKRLQASVFFSFYYRRLLKPELLRLASLGAYNVHGSLLPVYRGGSPSNWAIIQGETTTGVTLHHMAPITDAGNIVAQQVVTIDPLETGYALLEKMAFASENLLKTHLPTLLSQTVIGIPQDPQKASYFPQRKPEDGALDWQQDAQTLFNKIRALTRPYPGAYTLHEGKKLIIWWADIQESSHVHPAGTLLSQTPWVMATGKNNLILTDTTWETT